ncbi:DUF389 domain-containing protein [Cyanobacterium aponinum]|uniref:Hydrophobic domain protein n=1 Tax=Cyanobacterium aponinum (strain PCC 10605) TaxID=755178 RepID=K9Z3U6_CYAAP|nr:DUF389 domain-containing protein [Cyanobacterium aponinum]AFZ53804.1 protein of unknown function DUF389 [Cyanobacterium aponinum PCC 10605]
MNKINFVRFQQIYSQWCNKKKIKAIFRWLRMLTYRLMPPSHPEEIKTLHLQLSQDSAWSKDFILCTVSSCLIATFGLIANSSAVIIGAMIVAPLMLPLRGLAFSACEGELLLFRRAFLSIVGATLVSLFLSSFIAQLVGLQEVSSEISARTQPNLIDLGIAISAGAISGFGKVRKGISDTLAGTAIAVALMPPLCVVGISLTMDNYSYALGAFLLYATNLLGITLACMIVFIISGYTKPSQALGWTSLLTLLLIIPLSASFYRLIQQQRIEREIRAKLVNETITVGTGVEDTQIQVIWTTQTPTIYVTMETDKEITPNQVRLVQDFLNQRLQREFELVFYVVPLHRITTEIPTDNPQPSDITKPTKDNIRWQIDKNNYLKPYSP